MALNISEIAEVVVGMLFVYALLSMANSQIQEYIAVLLNWRAENLAAAIRGMIADETPTAPGLTRMWIMAIPRVIRWIARNTGLTLVLTTISRNPALANFLEGLSTKIEASKIVTRWKNFTDPPVSKSLSQANEFVQELYDHPLLTQLFESGRRPSYIPARQFTLALFDIVMAAGTDDSLIQQAFNQWDQKLKEIQSATPGLLDNVTVKDIMRRVDDIKIFIKDNKVLEWHQMYHLREQVNKITTQGVAIANQHPAFKQALDQLLLVLPSLGSDENAVAYINRGIQRLTLKYPDLFDLRKRLALLLVDAQIGLQQVESQATWADAALGATRTRVETWYDDTMDRANGWYKRNVQVMIFLTGSLLVFMLNVDTVHIANTLWREPSIRQAIATQTAQTLAEQQNNSNSTGQPAGASISQHPAEIISNTYKAFNAVQLPIGWLTLKYREPTLDSNKQEIRGLACDLWPVSTHDAKYEVFWGVRYEDDCWVPVDQPKNEGGIVALKIVGLLLSAFATTQGAQFWFDMLKKVMNVRISGATTEEEN